MSVISAVRSRTVSTVLLFAVIAGALLTGPAMAEAAASPYPPSTSCTPGDSSAGTCSLGVGGGSTHRAPDANDSNTGRTQTTQTAGTGFQALTATAVAVALLGGGLVLVIVGRRRRHS